jgi:general transcription factor 3C polypeptide 3 (transcription factor C subunit 4)
MVNLSLGLAYVHHGLKRQSSNRQYLILQGQTFISQYADLAYASGDVSTLAEMHYNVGRLFHLIGMASMAMKYYSLAMHADKDGKGSGPGDIAVLSTANQLMSLLSVGNRDKALALVKDNLTL